MEKFGRRWLDVFLEREAIFGSLMKNVVSIARHAHATPTWRNCLWHPLPIIQETTQQVHSLLRAAVHFFPHLLFCCRLEMAAAPYHHRLLLFFLTLCSFSPFCFPLSDADALLQLKRSFANADATLSSWVPNSSPCQARWVGVVCYNTTITGLHLSDLGLSGKIDIDAMVNVPTLRTVSFMNNSFSGPIPEFNKLGALKALYISTNQFSGPIPPDFFSFLDSLKKVWLSGNKFSGNIPDSLTELDMLKELHLENNEFSGPIPAFTQDIKSLDFSNNKLQGQIPETLSRFGAEAFKGNDGLCGKPLDKPCGGAQSNSVPSDEAGQQESSSRIVLLLVCVAIAVLIMIAIKSSKQRRGGDDFSVLSRENTDEVIQVQATTGSNKSRESESTKRGGSVRRGAGKNANGDLVLVNGEKGMFGMPDLMKAAAEVLGNGALGSAYKAAMGGGLCVVVKRMREMNQAGRDCFDAEMRGFGRIRHPNILTPLAYHFRKEEKLVVSEYMPRGSLLYVLHGSYLFHFPH